jgi:catechol 2,3-dioxygenase-like lactoylglutathione lyase family enzyme
VTVSALRITHIGALVRDVDRTAAFLADLLGWGPWHVYDLVPPRLDQRVYRDGEGTFGMVGAEVHVGDVDFALNQAVTGPSIYDEYLARRGEGLHHVACMAGAGGIAAIRSRFADAGVGVAMAGRIEETIEFLYFDSEPMLGVSIESGSGHAISLEPDRLLAAASGRAAATPYTGAVLVVRDLDATVAALTALLGWGPWDIAEVDSARLTNVRRAGREVEIVLRTARATAGAIVVELVQPVSGPSVEQSTLEAVGPGLHHIICRPPMGDKAVIAAKLAAHGVETVLSGVADGSEFWYLDSVPRLKLVFNG